jgi:hypothetical protein
MMQPLSFNLDLDLTEVCSLSKVLVNLVSWRVDLALSIAPVNAETAKVMYYIMLQRNDKVICLPQPF